MDIAVINENAEFKLNLVDGDFEADEGLETAVLISLFTDARVSEEELPPGHVSKRGYWGDMFPEVEGDKIGSKLWVFDRNKITQLVLTQFENEASKALQWMIDDKLAKAVAVSATRDEANRLILDINITKPDEKNNRFGFIWDGQKIKRL